PGRQGATGRPAASAWEWRGGGAMRRDVDDRLDRVLREALVVEPPPELQARLMALVESAPLATPAAPERRWLLWLDPNVWLGLVAVAVLAWSAWSALAWLA